MDIVNVPKHFKKDTTINRFIYDENDNIIYQEDFYYESLDEALKDLQGMYKVDEIMYHIAKDKPRGLVATCQECVNNGHSYTIRVQRRNVRRTIVCGISYPSQHANEVFMLPNDEVKMQ